MGTVFWYFIYSQPGLRPRDCHRFPNFKNDFDSTLAVYEYFEKCEKYFNLDGDFAGKYSEKKWKKAFILFSRLFSPHSSIIQHFPLDIKYMKSFKVIKL